MNARLAEINRRYSRIVSAIIESTIIESTIIDSRPEPAIDDIPRNDAAPYAEIHGNELHYVVVERGMEYERRITESDDEFLYWLICDLASGLATAEVYGPANQGVDLRAKKVRREIELIGLISEEWKKRRENEMRSMLNQHGEVS